MSYEVKDFSVDVIQASHNKPVLVDFWADWCGPCKVLGPVLEKLATDNNGEWKLIKINSDEHPELSQKYGIRSIPAVKLFHKGEVVNEFVGALPEPAIKEWLKKNIPNKFHDMLTHAEALLSSGDENEAQIILTEVLSQDPNNGRAKILLARIYLFENTEKAIQLISGIEETRENAEIINSLRTIAELINEKHQLSVEESPTKEIYLEAVSFLREKKFEKSLEKFIEIIRTDRYYADDVARKACIAIFKFLGEENEITSNYRRDFGRALYV
jgi:putative thioredoxin